jgi:hypothetical protein
VRGAYAFILESAARSALWILDVSTPAEPRVVGHLEWAVESSVPSSLAVVGQHAFVGDWQAGMHIVDVSDPERPIEVSVTSFPSGVLAVTATDSYVFVAASGAGVRVVDASDPTQPDEVGVFDTDGEAVDVALAGNFLYVADRVRGVRIVDVSRPTDPVEVGVIESEYRAEAVTTHATYVYVLERGSGIHVVDVSDPRRPRSVGRYEDTDLVGAPHVVGRLASMPGGRRGLLVLDLDIGDLVHSIHLPSLTMSR